MGCNNVIPFPYRQSRPVWERCSHDNIGSGKYSGPVWQTWWSPQCTVDKYYLRVTASGPMGADNTILWRWGFPSAPWNSSRGLLNFMKLFGFLSPVKFTSHVRMRSCTCRIYAYWQGNSDSRIAVSQLLLQLLHTDETEQKAPDVEIISGKDCGLWILQGSIIPSKCGCNFLTGNVFPLVLPEFKHCWQVFISQYSFFLQREIGRASCRERV